MNWPYWFELAVVFGIFAIGTIFFGHFESETPRWRLVTKVFVVATLGVVVSATAGRVWFFVMLGVMTAGVVIIHAWWLPKHGINGWTGEPREKYFQLRGWKWKPPPRDG